MEAHVKHLSKDKILKKLATSVGPVLLTRKENVYLILCRSIVSQQLSVKAADTIYGRFLKLYGDAEPTPGQILATPPEQFYSAGLSRAKALYMHNVARFEIEHGMGLPKLDPMSNEEIIEYLTQIKGVGRWTVEMLLMSVLAREDVFAMDDLGIQNAVAKHYGLNRKHKRFRKQMQKIAEAWSPYRTYACIYLWKGL